MMETSREIANHILATGVSGYMNKEDGEKTLDAMTKLFDKHVETKLKNHGDIGDVSECMEVECKSKRYWHFIYCQHHARRKKLI